MITHWFDTSAGGLLAPDGIINPVVSVVALTWSSRVIIEIYQKLLNDLIRTKLYVFS